MLDMLQHTDICQEEELFLRNRVKPSERWILQTGNPEGPSCLISLKPKSQISDMGVTKFCICLSGFLFICFHFFFCLVCPHCTLTAAFWNDNVRSATPYVKSMFFAFLICRRLQLRNCLESQKRLCTFKQYYDRETVWGALNLIKSISHYNMARSLKCQGVKCGSLNQKYPLRLTYLNT